MQCVLAMSGQTVQGCRIVVLLLHFGILSTYYKVGWHVVTAHEEHMTMM